MANFFRKTVLLTLFLTFIYMIPVFAADPVIMGCVSDEDEIKVYVRDVENDAEEAEFQIGTIVCEPPAAYPIEKDEESIRTLILIDNSISISNENREKTKELLKNMIGSHTEGEQFRLATFEKQVEYLSDFSTDYTALERLAETIEYSDQDTYLTNVISGIIDDLGKEGYQGFTRIVVIADGVDNKQTGMATEDLYNKIKENNYPIYTIGSKNKNNAQALEDMYAISELTHADHCVLDDVDDPGEISEALRRDQELQVYEVDIPDEAKNGAVQSCRLSLHDGSDLVIDIRMPFGEGAEKTEETEEKAEEEISESEAAPEVPETEDEDEDTDDEGRTSRRGLSFILMICGGAAAIILIILFVVVYVVQKSRDKKKVKVAPEPEMPAAETEFVNLGDDIGGTHMLFSEAGRRNDSGRILSITDRKDPSKTFRQALHHPVIIGRAAGCDIVIDYDKSVSGKHCLIKEENGRLFIQDMGSANKTKVNGEVILSETELTGGEVITLGRVELTVGVQ